jgi:hypothetical protein
MKQRSWTTLVPIPKPQSCLVPFFHTSESVDASVEVCRDEVSRGCNLRHFVAAHALMEIDRSQPDEGLWLDLLRVNHEMILRQSRISCRMDMK